MEKMSSKCVVERCYSTWNLMELDHPKAKKRMNFAWQAIFSRLKAKGFCSLNSGGLCGYGWLRSQWVKIRQLRGKES